ncbi:MAG: DUF2933 domain-containing protein [Acidimicrobiales bacterium]
MKNLHYGHCLIGVGLAVVALIAFGVSAGTLGFLAVVAACPLMMFVMMKMMMGDQSKSTSHDDHPVGQDQRR